MDEISIVQYPDSDPVYGYGRTPTYDSTPSYGSSGAASSAGVSYNDLSNALSGLFAQFNTDNKYNNANALKNYFNLLRENTDYNNSWSAAQAQKQMDFQRMERMYAQMFNESQAAKNRNWQEYLSNTAHQREVADLRAAGLNPVLSASGGNGAPVTSGSTASISAGSGAKGDGDQSANMAITSLLGGFLSAMTNMESQRLSAQTNLAVAEKYNQMSKLIEEMKINYGMWEHENYPSNLYQALPAIINALTGEDPSDFIGSTAQRVLSAVGLSGFGSGVSSKLRSVFNPYSKKHNYGDLLSGYSRGLGDQLRSVSSVFRNLDRKLFPRFFGNGGSYWQSGSGFSGSRGKF